MAAPAATAEKPKAEKPKEKENDYELYQNLVDAVDQV